MHTTLWTRGAVGLVASALLISALVFTGACAPLQPLATATDVDLDQFMGDWYVQGHVPADAEKTAYNAVESYARAPGSKRIDTTYVFRKGGFDGKLKTMEPTGFVENSDTNATWGMRFLWLFRLEYLIAYLDESYTETIIARRKRDYAWIMTRDPEISSERYEKLVERLVGMGYDPSEIRRVPQRWPDSAHPASSDLAGQERD
jgi:apolipoprotein D and lipocalin family protein